MLPVQVKDAIKPIILKWASSLDSTRTKEDKFESNYSYIRWKIVVFQEHDLHQSTPGELI
jgi:hypothetical protein